MKSELKKASTHRPSPLRKAAAALSPGALAPNLSALLADETKIRETGIRLEPLSASLRGILESFPKQIAEVPSVLRAIAADCLRAADEIEIIVGPKK